MTWLDLWRGFIAFLCAICAFLSAFCICVAVARRRQRAEKLCVPWRVMVGVWSVVLMVSVGQGAQMIWWAHHDVPFAWFRSPLLFPAVVVTLVVLVRMVFFVYRRPRL